jgi:hypothetical protein
MQQGTWPQTRLRISRRREGPVAERLGAAVPSVAARRIDRAALKDASASASLKVNRPCGPAPWKIAARAACIQHPAVMATCDAARLEWFDARQTRAAMRSIRSGGAVQVQRLETPR